VLAGSEPLSQDRSERAIDFDFGRLPRSVVLVGHFSAPSARMKRMRWATYM
jgi:hypothetical protein